MTLSSVNSGPTLKRRKTISTFVVCLADDCRSSWGGLGTSLWSLNGTTLWPSSVTNSLAVGWTGAAPPAKFLVEPRPNFQADVAIASDSTATKIVIGVPTSLQTHTMTCNDGVCNGEESATWGNSFFCAADCDSTAPGAPDPFFTSPDQALRTVTYTWNLPVVSPDSQGTRIVRKINSPSTSPTDGLFIMNIPRGSCSPTCTYTTPVLSAGTNYYHSFYVYDQAPNYSNPPAVNFTRF